MSEHVTYVDYLKTLSGCPFCENESRIILRTGEGFLTYSISPYHKHHLMVIPNRHVESLFELSQSEKDDLDLLQIRALEILKKLGYESISLLVREGNVENKSIKHIHFHAIPNIRVGDLDHYGQERRVMTESEIHQTLEDIKKVL
jgi:diadenosine tetraphosphate (Ap4A) HIT family hydrolase